LLFWQIKKEFFGTGCNAGWDFACYAQFEGWFFNGAVRVDELGCTQINNFLLFSYYAVTIERHRNFYFRLLQIRGLTGDTMSLMYLWRQGVQCKFVRRDD